MDQQQRIKEGKAWSAAHAIFEGLGGALALAATTAWLTKIFQKEKYPSFSKNFSSIFEGKGKWFAAGFATFYSGISYARQRLLANSEEQLFADNIAMRSQLNQTGQILQHVAKQVEKGTLKDSELSVNDEAPPSHVAKLKATEGEQALEDVLTKVANKTHHQTHGSHAEHEKHRGSHRETIAERRDEAAHAEHTLIH